MMTGVVIALATWYVPTVLHCSERFVRTTKPQKDAASGRIFGMTSVLGLNTPSHAHA